MTSDPMEAITKALAAEEDTAALQEWAGRHEHLFDAATVRSLAEVTKFLLASNNARMGLRAYAVLARARELTGDAEGHIDALLAWGDLLTELGIQDEAVDRYEQARTVLSEHELGDEVEADILARLATSYRKAQLPDEAAPLLERVLALDEASGDSVAIGKSLGNLAAFYSQTGNPARAYQYHLRALDSFRQHEALLSGWMPLDYDIGGELLNCGHTCLLLGDVERAAAYFRESAGRLRQARSRRKTGPHELMAELFGRASGAPGEEERAMARLEIIGLLRLAACEQKLHRGDMPATMAAASALATQFGHESLLIRLDPGRTNAD